MLRQKVQFEPHQQAFAAVACLMRAFVSESEKENFLHRSEIATKYPFYTYQTKI